MTESKPKRRVLTDRERHLAAVHSRRTPADRARLLAERLDHVAAMRALGLLPASGADVERVHQAADALARPGAAR